jgi:hypothetical protein
MYETGTTLTPQRIRGNVGHLAYYEQDKAIGFYLENVSDGSYGEGADYDLFVANYRQHALNNVLCAVNDIHSTADRYLVPAHFFNEDNHTDEATATAAFLASFRGINLIAPKKGKPEIIPVAQTCMVEFDCNAAVYVAGTLLTCVWDTDHIHPFKLKATTDPEVAIARVVETAPLLPKTGNATKVLARIEVGVLPVAAAP